MTIGFDGSRAFVSAPTGTENYSYQLLKAIAKVDIENVYLIYLRPGQNPGKDWPENFKFKIINFPRLWTQAGLAMRTFLDPIDLLFVPAHTLPLIRRPGLKTVMTVHDLGSEYLPGLHQLKQALYLKFITYIQLKGAAKLIAVSKATKKDLVKKVGLDPKKIEVIYEAVSGQFKVDLKSKFLNQIDIEKNKYFLFAGTIQPRKNLERLIKSFGVFARDKNFRLILAGQKGWKSDRIYTLPAKLGIQDKVMFPGRISDQELKVLYNNAMALMYPSLFEGFGLPILEAFACGCPVITSNVSSMPEIAGNAALLVNPESEKEITAAMIKIAEDEKLRDTLIQKGYERLKDFSWEKTAKETIEVFKEAVEK